MNICLKIEVRKYLKLYLKLGQEHFMLTLEKNGSTMTIFVLLVKVLKKIKITS